MMSSALCPKCGKDVVNKLHLVPVNLQNKDQTVHLLTCGSCHTIIGIYDAETAKTVDRIFLKL